MSSNAMLKSFKLLPFSKEERDMSRSYRSQFFGLFLFILLPISIVAEYHHATITVNFTQSNKGCPTEENRKLGLKSYRPHNDFSHHRESGEYGRLSDHKTFFDNYTVHDFRDYFIARGYTESEILDQSCLYMSEVFVKYAQTCPGYKNKIREMYAELKNLTFWQKAYYALKGTYCRKLQKRIGKLYKSLDPIKEEPQIKGYYNVPDTAEKTFYPIESFAEYQALEYIYQSHTPNLAKAINARSVIYKNSPDGSSCLQKTNKSYNLNSNIQQLLSRSGHDINAFARCYGNQLQQAIHEESLDILNHVDNLPASSILYDHQEALIDLTVSIVEYNHADMADKAMCVADLCWTLLDYGQAIAEGVTLGLYSAAHDILTNPIEATASIVAGKQVLAFQLCKVLYNVADIGVTAITNFDEAQEKWNKYAEPLNNIIDAINKKEITVRDAIKGVTAFVVGYKAQGKLLGGLGKLCNTIKHKSINFVKNNSLLNPQEYLTTPEGLLFKAASKSNKIKLSGKTNDGSHLKNIIDNKVSKSEALYAVTASGKGILCKGDLRAKIERYKEHIFSPEHQRDGILTLGKDKATIMDSLHNIIVSLDQKGLLKEGANQIKASINGVNSVEIRCFVQNGEAISVNAFLSRFNRIYGNFIDVMKV
jgi:hypothetical protein